MIVQLVLCLLWGAITFCTEIPSPVGEIQKVQKKLYDLWHDVGSDSFEASLRRPPSSLYWGTKYGTIPPHNVWIWQGYTIGGFIADNKPYWSMHGYHEPKLITGLPGALYTEITNPYTQILVKRAQEGTHNADPDDWVNHYEAYYFSLSASATPYWHHSTFIITSDHPDPIWYGEYAIEQKW